MPAQINDFYTWVRAVTDFVNRYQARAAYAHSFCDSAVCIHGQYMTIVQYQVRLAEACGLGERIRRSRQLDHTKTGQQELKVPTAYRKLLIEEC